MKDRRIKLDLSYDGTDFCGWQIQNEHRSVQEEIETALEKILHEKIHVTGSGRTDSGVHAAHQIAHFDCKGKMDVSRFIPALNSTLPCDVRILSACEVPNTFNARHSAVERIYQYYICPKRNAPTVSRNYCWETFQNHDIENLNEMASVLVGTHDFTTFSNAGDANIHKNRTLFGASFFYVHPFIVFRVSGNAFLWKMVRSLTGTIIEVERKGGTAKDFKKILELKDRSLAGTTAPAKGLFLHDVIYDGRKRACEHETTGDTDDE